MKLRFIAIIVLFNLVLNFSCKEKKSEEAPTKMEEIMAIHDEVMPEMSTLSKLVAELKPLADTTAVGKQYARAMMDLQNAHKSMMDWMAGFGGRFDSEEILEGKALSQQKKQWLLEEEVKVRAMRDSVNFSIARARALLEKD